MQHDPLVYVGHMLDFAQLAIRKASAAGRDGFLADDTLQLALLMLVQRIGEAASHVSSDFRTAHPEVPWHSIVGMRHRIVHDYLNINLGILWNVVSESLPALVPHLEAILAEPNP